VTKIRDEIKIVTHKNSFVEYWITDYFRIKQAENTLFEFKQVKLIEGNLLSLLHWGTVHGYIRKDGKLIKEWIIRTPAALTKISQTEFVIEVAENGTTTLTVLSGEVDLSDLSMDKTVTVKENEKSTVQPGGTPSYPEPSSPNKIEKWWEITETTESASTLQGFAEGDYTWLIIVVTIAIAAIVAVLGRKRLRSSKVDTDRSRNT